MKTVSRLTARREAVLKAIVGEYIATALPVPSETIVQKYKLDISPATVRNEMVVLEKEGYISRPHTSAGGVPLDRGYRYYVESLLETRELPAKERLLIQHLFHQVESHLEEWTKVAAAISSRMASNAALATIPKAPQCRFKHMELVALHEFVALLVLVLQEARLKQQLLALDAAYSQEQLWAAANHLNSTYGGLTSRQVAMLKVELSPLEKQVARTVTSVMQTEDKQEYEELYVDGLRHILRQPEFAREARWQALLAILEERSLAKALLPSLGDEEGVRVFIGDENRDEAIRDCSLVVSRYGVPGEISGVIGVLGPMRMRYDYTIATVSYISALMSELVAELRGQDKN